MSDAPDSLLSLLPDGKFPDGVEPPVRLELSHGDPWPIHVMVPWVRHYIEEAARDAGAPLELVAQGVLALFATALSGKFVVHAVSGKTWQENLNLYLCAVAASGERKSAALDPIVDLIQDWEIDRARSDERRKKSLRIDYLTALLKRLKLSANKQDDAEDRERMLEEMMGTENQLAEEISEMVDPHILADDVTSEALNKNLPARKGRTSIIVAEANLFENMIDNRYGSAAMNLDPFLKGYKGTETIKVDRVGTGEIHIRNIRLTLCVMVQPQVIERLGNNDRAVRRGLLARFLVSWPKSLVGTRLLDMRQTDRNKIDSFKSNARKLLDLPDTFDDNGQLMPKKLSLTSEAEATFIEYYNEIERRQAPGGDLQDHQLWCGRLAGFVLRLAGIIAITDECGPPSGMRITEGVIARAITLGNYFLGEQKIANEGMAQSAHADIAKKILHKVERWNTTSFNRQQLRRSWGTSCPALEPLKAALALLVESGHLTELEPPNKRTSPTYLVSKAVVPGSAPKPEPENIGPYLTGKAGGTRS